MSVLTDLHSTFPLSRRRSTRPGAPGSDGVAKNITGGRLCQCGGRWSKRRWEVQISGEGSCFVPAQGSDQGMATRFRSLATGPPAWSMILVSVKHSAAGMVAGLPK
jgi:hypothetical protein